VKTLFALKINKDIDRLSIFRKLPKIFVLLHPLPLQPTATTPGPRTTPVPLLRLMHRPPCASATSRRRHSASPHLRLSPPPPPPRPAAATPKPPPSLPVPPPSHPPQLPLRAPSPDPSRHPRFARPRRPAPSSSLAPALLAVGRPSLATSARPETAYRFNLTSSCSSLSCPSPPASLATRLWPAMTSPTMKSSKGPHCNDSDLCRGLNTKPRDPFVIPEFKFVKSI